ncbi:MAG: prolyl oligopeptidase family serine peptidase [Vicinamibacterales bacterium]
MTRPLARRPILAVALAALAASTLTARQPRALQPPDYGRWEQLVTQRTPLSPDGRWLVYGITRANRQNELRVQPSDGGAVTALPFGEQPAFSDDSKWLAWSIGFSEEQEAKLRKDKKPLHEQLGLLELATGRQLALNGVESFAFSPSGTHIALRRYAPEPAGGAAPPTPAGSDETIAPGTTLVVRELATGRDTTFGNVSEMTWQDKGPLLAFAVTVEGGVGNGVQVLDTASGTLRALDSSSSTYSGLAWRKDSASLAVLRSQVNDTRDGPTHVVLAWPDVASLPGQVRELDAAKSGLDTSLRVVRFRAPQWSEDGSRIYVGVASWPGKPVRPADTAMSRRVAATSDNPDELPDVQVWHPKDTTVMARQRVDARRERQRSMLAAWWVEEERLVRIASAIGEEATPIRHQPRALVVDTNAYAMERSIGRVYANAWTVDLRSGTRSEPVSRIEDRYLQSSPGGRYLLYLKNDHYWTMELATGRQTNITAAVKTSFVDTESDATGPHQPAFGVAGWTRDDGAVLLYDRLDIWEVRPDGSGAIRLTHGAAGEVRHRYARLDPDEDFIDRAQPLHVSTFGLRSKKSGFARIAPGAPSASSVTALAWLDRRVDRLAKAKKADRYAYVVQAFDDSPDYYVGGESLADAKQVSATNPFMREYAWGRAEVVDYRSAQGRALQASVFYPAGYEPGKRYPMVVYMYEKLSDGVHQFSMPDERQYYNPAAFTTRGYVYLQPDIVFRPREPGVSVVESVVPAVQTLVQMGVADAAKVGIVGHSWGGFDSVYLATHTDVFAAAVAGAPITNLVSNYGNHHWSSGIAETDHIETGQQRMAVPVYEDLPAYIRNSAVFRAHAMKTPLLVAFGDNDGTVHWHQGVELYNIARRAGKHVVLLQYGAEDHGLRKKANQIDYHHRIFEWFDHYLAGAPAAPWITSGERFLDRERDLQRRKLPAKPAATPTAPAPPGP